MPFRVILAAAGVAAALFLTPGQAEVLHLGYNNACLSGCLTKRHIGDSDHGA